MLKYEIRSPKSETSSEIQKHNDKNIFLATLWFFPGGFRLRRELSRTVANLNPPRSQLKNQIFPNFVQRVTHSVLRG